MLYDIIARFYDGIHTELSADVPLILEIAGDAKGEILELGCGTGRLLLPLSTAGHHLTGVDNAPAMLEKAQTALNLANTAQNVTLLTADIASLALPKTDYAMAILSHNTLMHLPTRQWGVLFKRIARHLAANGLFFLDLANPLWLTATEDEPDYELERTFPDPLTGADVDQYSRYHCDFFDQKLHVEWRFDLHLPEGIAQQFATTDYYYEHPHVIYDLFESAGFQWSALYGDYDKSEFGDESERLIIVGRKSTSP